MNNGGGGIFDFLPIARHRDGYEELFGTPTGLDLAKVADLYGLRLHARGSYAGSARRAGAPGLVEIPLDRPRNVRAAPRAVRACVGVRARGGRVAPRARA